MNLQVASAGSAKVPSFVDLREFAQDKNLGVPAIGSVAADPFLASRRFLDLPHERVAVGVIALAAGNGKVDSMPYDEFCKDFSAYRFDEVLGDWKPYYEVVYNSLLRTANKWKVPFRASDVSAIYEAVPTWGPHPDTVAGPAKIADKIPLVILSNAMDHQLVHNVQKLEVPFHRVYTAQQAKAYKPRRQAFEYMIDQLDAKPEDFLHVSSSMRYDLMSAHDMGIKNKAFVNRGHEPGTPFYGYSEIKDIGGLAALVGL